jgi:hypothetical protein
VISAEYKNGPPSHARPNKVLNRNKKPAMTSYNVGTGTSGVWEFIIAHRVSAEKGPMDA